MNPLADPHAVFVLLLAITTFGYVTTCAIWPFKSCRRCYRTGRLRSPVVKAIRLCPNCDATGLRIRIGRHAWNAFSRLHRKNRHDRKNR